MQFKFLLIALFFAVIVNAQQSGGSDGGDSLTGKARSVLSSLTGSRSMTSGASSAVQTSASEPTSSMTSMSESSSMATSSMSETSSGTTSATTATSTSGAGNTMSYGLPTEMIALVALFIASFIVIVT